MDVDGVDTRYFEQGKGETVLLIYGGDMGSAEASTSAAIWERNFAGLTRDFHVIAPDKLGQGHTGNPKSDEEYTMHAVIQHMNGLIETLGLKQVHVVGHSRGGYLATRLTMEHGDKIKSTIIVDSGTLAPGIELNAVVLANPPTPLLSRECQRWIYERYAYSTEHITDELLDAVEAVAALPKYRECVRKMIEEDLKSTVFNPQLYGQRAQTLGELRDQGMGRPTHLIWGYNDPTASLAQGRVLYDLIAARERNARYHVFNEAGHFT
ncbi:MAG: alpha/beta hydrolase, partial [Rhodospirillales bacterium]|nr:alpha/beta hydrolase [Rhodospirillales bacterium]